MKNEINNPNGIQREPNVVNMVFGSHLYGLDTPDSDIDYKGIYIPTLKELLLNEYPGTYKTSTGGKHTKNGAGDIDQEVISLPKFIKHAIDGETFALDMLHCETPLSSSPVWEYLVSMRHKFYSKQLKAYMGYVKKQAAKYGLKGSRLACIRNAIDTLKQLNPDDKLEDHIAVSISSNDVDIGFTTTVNPKVCDLYLGEFASIKVHHNKNGKYQLFYEVNMKRYQSTNTVEYVLTQLEKMYDGYGERAKAAESNEGVDWKALSHALRAGYQARDIYLHGDFSYPLKETEFLAQVKAGELDYKTIVCPELERLVDNVQELADNSDLPSKVNVEFWNKWLLSVYDNEFDELGLKGL